LAIESGEKEPGEVEQVYAAAELFSATRVAAIQGHRGTWFANAHLALIGITQELHAMLESTFSSPELEEDGTPYYEPIGWGEALTEGNREELASLVQEQLGRFRPPPNPGGIRQTMGRLLAEARVEEAKAVVLLSGATPGTATLLARKRKKGSYETEAMVLLTQHPDWTDAAIAAELGIHRSNLSKYPRYRNLRRATSEGLESRRRGHREHSEDDSCSVDGLCFETEEEARAYRNSQRRRR
jgi:hypothetical protein